MKKAEILDRYDDILTAKQAAEILKCSIVMVYKLCDNGTLAHYRVGSAYRVYRYSVLNQMGLSEGG